MKADATRRLLSMDLGDDDERAEWEEWGNRAALERSAPSLSIPELFAEQVVRDPGLLRSVVVGGRCRIGVG